MKKLWLWIIICLSVIVLTVGALAIYENTISPPMMIKKPALYLYPETDMGVDVNLHLTGDLVVDIPDYNDGWNVFVTKEGLINNEYDYLFYEATLKKISLPDEGWIVRSDNLESWFKKTLPELGLNEKETSQFMEYWLEELDEDSYYEVKLFSQEFLDENLGLEIIPQPDTIIRLNFYFKPVDKQIELSPPIIDTPDRIGFTVVEWGGVLAN